MTKNKNSVQGLICLERFTRFGVKTDKVEIVFFSVEPTNISVLSAANYNVPLVKTQMKKIIVTAKTLYSHPKNVSKIYAALHTDLAW